MCLYVVVSKYLNILVGCSRAQGLTIYVSEEEKKVKYFPNREKYNDIKKMPIALGLYTSMISRASQHNDYAAQIISSGQVTKKKRSMLQLQQT